MMVGSDHPRIIFCTVPVRETIRFVTYITPEEQGISGQIVGGLGKIILGTVYRESVSIRTLTGDHSAGVAASIIIVKATDGRLITQCLHDIGANYGRVVTIPFPFIERFNGISEIFHLTLAVFIVLV